MLFFDLIEFLVDICDFLVYVDERKENKASRRKGAKTPKDRKRRINPAGLKIGRQQ